MATSEEYNKLYQRALRFLSMRQHTEREMRRYLIRVVSKEKIREDVVEKIISQLKTDRYIDDPKFVRDYIDLRSTHKQKGKRGLTFELQKKGIKPAEIDAYFSNNAVDEHKLAGAALKKVWERYNNLNRLKRYQKASQFLLRRGFSYEAIRKTIEEFEESE